MVQATNRRISAQVDAIALGECRNDGAVIHLYRSEAAWLAFRRSAHALAGIAAARAAACSESHSRVLMMPAVEIAEAARQALEPLCDRCEETAPDHRIPHLHGAFEQDRYLPWAEALRERGNHK